MSIYTLDLTPSERDELLLALDIRWADLDRMRHEVDKADKPHFERKQQILTDVMEKLTR